MSVPSQVLVEQTVPEQIFPKGTPKKPISVLLLINSLGCGGAETMLYRLLSKLDRKRFRPQAVVLIDVHPPVIAEKIRALGIPVRSLGMRPGGAPSPIALLRLIRWLRQEPPDVIQTWQYYSDLAGAVAARLAGGIPVAWGIHHSTLNDQEFKRRTILTATMCARLSRWLPQRIVCCSEASREVHAGLGYAGEKMVVIPNGYDLDEFKPDPVARELVRKELQIPPEAPVIGLVARFHILKDHRSFVRAASLLHRDRPDVHFVLCGYDVTWENRELVTWIEEAGIRSRCHLLGLRDDIPKVTAAVDIACLTSSGEAFPNVVSEAMSCGVPCVVTDVGDAALIVGQTGIVVPPRNPDALAAAWRKMLDLGQEGRNHLGMVARQRIAERYSLPAIVDRYEHLFEELAHSARA
jgi:glycosyltransferase involved in cell wall biosynthesis